MTYAFASDTAHAGPARSRAHTRARRWGFVLAAVAALHGAAFVWFDRYRETFAPEAGKPPVQVVLLTPQPIARDSAPANPHGAPRASTPVPARAQPKWKAPVLQALTRAETQAAPPPARAASETEANAAAGASAPGGDRAAAAGPASGANAASTKGATSAGVRFSVPPSGNLRYNTFYNGVQNEPGTIRWSSDGDGYAMVVSVPLPFVGTFSYESRGRIDAFGLAPERYVEKRGRRPEDVTTFDRPAKRIGFTRTGATVALPDGAQDRFSMVMQLASLVRGNPDVYKPGVTRTFYVADNDSGEQWPIETIGDESIQTGEGFLEARHFMRLPRHEGDRRRIDVWLAPSLGWLPARIVQTEPNGSQFELVWRGALVPPGAKNAPSHTKALEDSSDASAGETEPMPERP